MTPALIVVIAVIAIALTIASARRALAERDAVDRHGRALDLLGTLSEGVDRVVEVVPVDDDYQPQHRAARRRRPYLLVALATMFALALATGVLLRQV